VSEDEPKRRTIMPSSHSLAAAPSTSASMLAEMPVVRELLAFVVSDESYALPLRSVREILKVPPITGVPRAPADVLGIISVRGRITTVRDLRRLLRVPESPADKHTRVLLVESDDEVVGLLVDRVLQVFRLGEDEVELAAVVGGDMSEHVMGVGRPSRTKKGERDGESDDDILVLLDPGPLLRRT
jgi:purine-binding chemotaxis protein CheW